MLSLLVLLLAADPGPLVAVAPALDRGEVRTGPSLAFAFELVHTGPGPLTISGVDTGCNCAKPEVSARHLQPGGRATVTVTVNTLTPSAGPNRWRVGVRYRQSEAEADRTLELTAAATLVREVAVSPPGLAASTAGAVTLPLTVTDRRPSHLTVTAATATSPHLTATVTPGTVGPDGVWSQAVAVAVAPTLPPGRHAETLVLATTDPTCPELRVPVTIDRRAPQEVRATPAALTLTAGGTGVVQLRRTNSQPVRVRSATCDHPGVTVTVTVDGSGPVATLRASVHTGTAAGEGVITVRLTEPAGRELAVPVRWGER